jgi:hypothetical protein
VCRLFLEGLCPCDLFVNTVRASCGGALRANALATLTLRRGGVVRCAGAPLTRRAPQKMSLGECTNMHSLALRVREMRRCWRGAARVALARVRFALQHTHRAC